MKQIIMVAGEASGDYLGAKLIRALKERKLEFEVSGICGPAMIKEGATALHTIDSLNSIGFDGLFGRIRKILQIRKQLIRDLLQQKPDIYIGIDAPDFNIEVEKRLRRAGIPTVQYVAPSIWAWRAYRIHKIKRAVSRILTIYPFESQLYEKARVPYTYIGHPLADEICQSNSADIRKKFGYSETDRVVAILPGSRVAEVNQLASAFVQTASNLAQTDRGLKFITPIANDKIRTIFENIVKEITPAISIQLVDGDSLSVMASADVVLLASGTAALEAALSGKPVVVAYRVSIPTLLMLKLFQKVKHYSVLNHLGDAPVIPEFMQSNCTVENLVGEVSRLLNDAKYRNQIVSKFDEFRLQLRRGANGKAADEIMRILER